jgi:hypothetical protein
MTTVAELEPDLARLHSLFVLEKLSQRLRSDVLADGSVIAACGFTAKRPAHLTDDIVVMRDELFAAFRTAPDISISCQLHDPNEAPVDAAISINEDGSGTVDLAGKKMRFPWVTLLSSDIDKRLARLDQFLHRYPLSDGDAASLRALVARPDYSDDDFLATATMLESSPESFTERLAEKLRRQKGENRIAPVDVLPDDDRYWNHLLPPADGSGMLADYTGKELRAEWQTSVKAAPVRALHAFATTFAAPELVPRDLLQDLSGDTAAAAIESISKVEDPFSLVGAFEICVDRIGQDQRFVALGDRLLDNLFGDMQRLTGACAFFSAIFVITTAHFATHETLQQRPVYWRRLAAVAHASLVVRVCGGNGIDPTQIISWAMRLFGNAYFLSVLSDFAVEPQWRPEWILPKILVADVFGRAAGAWHRLSQDAAPSSWKERIEKVYAWIIAEKIGAFAQYPSVLQGTRRPHRPTLAEFQSGIPQAADAFRELANNPSVNTLLSISRFIEAFGFPDEATGDAEQVLASIRGAPPNEDDNSTVLALSVLAHIAVLAENAALADSITEVCLERARQTENQGPIFEIACRLIECAAVIKDRAEAARMLVRRLEILAFIVPASEAAEGLAATIEMLKRIRPEMAPLLGRALAAARLGTPRAAAYERPVSRVVTLFE